MIAAIYTVRLLSRPVVPIILGLPCLLLPNSPIKRTKEIRTSGRRKDKRKDKGKEEAATKIQTKKEMRKRKKAMVGPVPPPLPPRPLCRLRHCFPCLHPPLSHS